MKYKVSFRNLPVEELNEIIQFVLRQDLDSFHDSMIIEPEM